MVHGDNGVGVGAIGKWRVRRTARSAGVDRSIAVGAGRAARDQVRRVGATGWTRRRTVRLGDVVALRRDSSATCGGRRPTARAPLCRLLALR